MAVGVLIAPELVDGQDEHAWREVYQYYGLLTGQQDWGADVTLIGLLRAQGGIVASNIDVEGYLRVLGHTYLGDDPADLLEVRATSRFFAGAAFDANVTLGDAAADAIVVKGTSTFQAPVTNQSTLSQEGNAVFQATSQVQIIGPLLTYGNVTMNNEAADFFYVYGTSTFNAPVGMNSNLTVAGTLNATGSVALGNAAADSLTVYATAAFQANVTHNSASYLVGTTLIGSSTVSGGMSNQILDVSNGRAYFSAPNEVFAIGLKYGKSTNAFHLGASNEASPALIFSNTAGGYLGRWTANGALLIGSTAQNGTEVLRVNGLARIESVLQVGGTPSLSLFSASLQPAGTRTLDGYFRVDVNGAVRWVPMYQ